MISPEESFIYPASFAQQRLWYLDQLEPGNLSYNMPNLFHLAGQLDINALEQSLNELARRHETLRTTFASQDGQPVQVIAHSIHIPLPLTDLCSLPETERQDRLEQMLRAEAHQSFDLQCGPLFRGRLFCLQAGEHVLLLNKHHIISDGWSSEVMRRELAQLYAAFCEGRPSLLPDLPIQYVDFTAWQRQQIQGEKLQSLLDYWRQQLTGLTPLTLPGQIAPEAVKDYHGVRCGASLTPSLTQALKALSRQQNTTLFMLMLAVLDILLQRHCGQVDIAIGTPIANRGQVELESLIGFFANTLVLRCDLSGSPTFMELLERVKNTCLDAYRHQDLPFEKLVEELNPQRSLHRNPLFNIFFNYAKLDPAGFTLPGLEVHKLEFPEILSRFPLTVYCQDAGETLRLELVYQQELFPAGQMAALLDQYSFLLQQIAAAPERPIDDYSLISPQAAALLPDPTAILPEPVYPPVTELFCDWARRTPDQPAILQGECCWSYAQLAQRSSQVAGLLLASGAVKGDVTAIAIPQSADLVACMLGILLSGGVFLTLDPALPLARRQTLLRESKAGFLLVLTPANSAGLSELEGLQTIQIAEELSQPVETAAFPNDSSPSGGDAAYIFFTSGSTGIPKAVLGSHQGLAHFLAWQRREFNIGPHDRVAQWTRLSFDVILRDIFLPLTSGAVLVIPTPEEQQHPDQIPAWLEKYAITLLHTTPSQALTWLADPPPEITLARPSLDASSAAWHSCSLLRYIFFAGEPLSDRLVSRWRSTFPQAGEIINLYGPTETTLAKCSYRVGTFPLPGIQPIGFPIPHTQALILSEQNRLCGIHELGEIVLRTPFRSLGYLNNLQENQLRFIANPFHCDPADLLYRTGDRGFYRPDGSIAILGRLDQQVKIRGIRVEPGEIEAAIEQHPNIQRAVVIAYEPVQAPIEACPPEKELAAYILTYQGKKISISELRTHLLGFLPAALVPVVFIFLDSLPLTPTGKVDRKALPPPAPNRLERSTQHTPPRTPTEEQIAEIWAQVLHKDNLSVEYNFFELGGHSLRATQVISRLNKIYQVELPLRIIFENPTICELAQAVESIRQAQVASRGTTIQPISRRN